MGEVNPGDVATVITSNRRLEHRVFAMKRGYGRSNGKLVSNARSESAVDKIICRWYETALMLDPS